MLRVQTRELSSSISRTNDMSNTATMLNVWKWNLAKASECARKSDNAGYQHYLNNAKDIEQKLLPPME